jgi:hypothetical protein
MDYKDMLAEARKSLPEVVFIKERFVIPKVVGHIQGTGLLFPISCRLQPT